VGKKLCLILGGGGFIGTALAQQALLDGWRVRVFDRPGVKVPLQFADMPGLEWISGDFQNPEDLALALDGVEAVV